MANLIPNELDALIKQFLTDGVLTAKEREVVLRKSEAMGLDRDEIDLYLDAEVQKIEQESDAASRKRKGKNCPFCGSAIPQLTEKCPHCGEHITAEASDELQEIFEKLEDALVDLKDAQSYKRNKAIVERYVRKAKMYYGSNPKVQKLLDEIELETEKAEKRAKTAETQRGLINIVRNKWVWCTIAVLCLSAFIYTCSHQSNMKKSEAELIAKAQCDSLCLLLDKLETPNASNYKQVENQLFKIVWQDVPNYDTSDREKEWGGYKKTFIGKKRAIAGQIGSVIINPDAEFHPAKKYEYNAPDEIRYPGLYIKN